ncbi:hypothetical protein C8Q80DRAFT_1275737 [Daedaleopsis nitida]|nr:hypothetical protein C8Q80DRAFT_1275737 [Daedaleopsis nitida]
MPNVTDVSSVDFPVEQSINPPPDLSKSTNDAHPVGEVTNPKAATPSLLVAPPARDGSYHPDLGPSVSAARAAGAIVVTFPGLLDKSAASLAFFTKLDECRSKPCDECVQRGRECVASTQSSWRCFACYTGHAPSCSWQDFMVDAGFGKIPSCRIYSVAEKHGLVAFPAEASWSMGSPVRASTGSNTRPSRSQSAGSDVAEQASAPSTGVATRSAAAAATLGSNPMSSAVGFLLHELVKIERERLSIEQALLDIKRELLQLKRSRAKASPIASSMAAAHPVAKKRRVE